MTPLTTAASFAVTVLSTGNDKIGVLAEASPLTPDLFRRVCGQFATGIAILTACDEAGQPHGMTINSFTSLSLDPPLVMAAISRTSNLLTVFEEAPNFAINILASTQQELSDRFARRHEDRFYGFEWHRGPVGAPLFEGVIATIECRRTALVDAGDHRILVGHVEVAQLVESDAEPLLFFRGRYAQLS